MNHIPTVRTLVAMFLCSLSAHGVRAQNIEIRVEDSEVVYVEGNDMVLKLTNGEAREWEEAVEKKDSTNPCSTGRSPHVPWLRDRLHTSNYILVKIPIEIHNLGHGERLTCMDSEPLTEELAVTDQDVVSLSQAGLVRHRPQKPRPQRAN
jgi:hypothetical protein